MKIKNDFSQTLSNEERDSTKNKERESFVDIARLDMNLSGSTIQTTLILLMMKKNLKLIAIIFCTQLLSSIASAQPTFEKRLTSPYTLGFGNIIELTNHTFMASGYGLDTSVVGLINTYNNVIAQFDSAGNMLWYKSWGGANDDQPYKFIRSIENNADYFLQIGASNSFYQNPPQTNDPTELYVVKYDINGDTLWTRDYGIGVYYTYISATTDSNYVIGRGDDLIKINRMDGNALWTKKYDLPGTSSIGFSSLSLTPDLGYYMAGSTITTFAADYSLLKTDASGNVNWCYVYGDTAANRSWAMTTTLDGGAIMVGESAFSDSSDVLVIRTNSFGDTLWCKSFDYNNSKDAGRSVLITPDNGCIVYASSFKYILTVPVSLGYLFKLDSLGNIVWSNVNKVGPGWVTSTADGGYIGGGQAIVKTDSLGTSCTSTPITLTAKSFPLQIQPVFPTVSTAGLNKCVGTNSFRGTIANPFTIVDNCIWSGTQQIASANSELSIYPNPTSSQLSIANLPSSIGKLTVTVYDVLGKQKLQQEFTVSSDRKIEMDVSGFTRGIYFLQVMQGSKQWMSKFVKE